MNKFLQIIRTRPMLTTVLGAFLSVLIFTLINQKPEKPVYQWEIESRELERKIHRTVL